MPPLPPTVLSSSLSSRRALPAFAVFLLVLFSLPQDGIAGRHAGSRSPLRGKNATSKQLAKTRARSVSPYRRASDVKSGLLHARKSAVKTLPLGGEKTGKKVTLHPLKGSFDVEQVWVVRGATREQLMDARKHLTLTGPTGLYQGSALMNVEVAPRAQGQNGRVDVKHVRPRGLPRGFGSRARTRLTSDGFVGGMSQGRLGSGESRVTIGRTRYEKGVPVVELRERGTYRLDAKPKSLLEAPMAVMFNLGAKTPPGMAAKTVAMKAMGELHNTVFDPASALINAVKKSDASYSEVSSRSK